MRSAEQNWVRKEGRRVKDRVEARREVTEAHASKPYAVRTVEKAGVTDGGYG